MGHKSQADTELDVADYALEEWAKWALSNNGYGASPSLKIMLDVRRTHVHPSLPHGVEVKREVINCNIVFGVMRQAGKKHQVDAIIVKAVALSRSENQSIEKLIKSIDFHDCMEKLSKNSGLEGIKVSRRSLYDARFNFAARYCTLAVAV